MSRDVGGDADASLILTRLNGATCWRANGAGGVEGCKPNPFLGKLIDVRRINDFVTVTGNISPAEIINKDEDDVGALRLLRLDGEDSAGENKKYCTCPEQWARCWDSCHCSHLLGSVVLMFMGLDSGGIVVEFVGSFSLLI